MQTVENHNVAVLFEQIADFLELKGENPFKIKAYQRAARTISGLERTVSELQSAGELIAVPGIGKAIAEKIGEYLEKGQIRLHEELATEFPIQILDLMDVPGLGAKKAALLYKELHIGSLADLEAALKDGRVSRLKGFGAKSEIKLLEGLARLKAGDKRTTLGLARSLADDLIDRLGQVAGVERVVAAGSLRRGRETVGDLDLVCVSTDPPAVMRTFCALVPAENIVAQGETKSSLRWAGELQVDLRVVPAHSFGAAMQYFTGSKDHNVTLRMRAEKRGLKLNEYGLFNEASESVAGVTEEEIYAALGLPWIPPELRETGQEIELAERGALPALLVQSDLRGNLHTHSLWSDGSDDLETLAAEALRRGFRYLAITDHSRSTVIANGLTTERLLAQGAEIRALNERLEGQLTLLWGSECDILPDGSMDFPDEVLAQLDWVVAAVHSSFQQSAEEMTVRILRALENPHVDILAHPTGRRLGKRPGYAADWEQIFKTAARLGKGLEINGSPNRLDLSDLMARRARDLGVRLCLNTDAHSLGDFDNHELAVGVARRAWLEKAHVINALELEELREWRRRS